MSNISTILRLLPAFKKKFFPATCRIFGQQWLRVNSKKEPYPGAKVLWQDRRNDNLTLSNELLIAHFEAKHHYQDKKLPAKQGGFVVPAVWGSYGCCLNFSGLVSPIGIDADNEQLMDLFETKLKPQLIKHDIDFIEEYRGTDDDRRHYWFFLDELPITYSNLLLEQFRYDASMDRDGWFPEQYPFDDREKALFCLPFGLYLKTMEVKWGNFKGKEITNLEEGLEAILQCKPIDLDKAKSIIKEIPREKKIYVAPAKVLIKPSEDLKVPIGTPDYIKKVAIKCQAINKFLWNIENPTYYIEHEPALGLAMMAKHNDKINETTEGREWIDQIESHMDEVDNQNHNLTYYWDKNGRDSTLKCSSWESQLNSCEGCKFKGTIRNPQQLINAETIKRERTGEVRLASFEEIREEVFPACDALIDKCLAANDNVDILLEPVVGVGKSSYADALAVRLAKEGKRVCISCNSTDVALEHAKRIEWVDWHLDNPTIPTGKRAFIMASYEAIFEKFSNGVICPESSAIKDLISLGIDSSYFKKKYCKECPFYEKCNYPRQYSQVQEEKYDIVIIQHAHLACTEVIRQIFTKDFDVLIIDETFIDQITTQLKPTSKEVEILEGIEFKPKWLLSLLNWFEGGKYPTNKINPVRNDLRPIMEAFKEASTPYRLDQFIRLYNEGEWLDAAAGVMKFTPLPRPTVRLLTDATPSVEEIKIVLDNPDIVRIGGGIYLDPTVYHPESKNIQVLDGRASKSQMLKKEILYEYLEWIGDLMMGKYKDDTALITVHMEAEQDAIEWLMRNYPSIMPRIQVNHMAVGSNEWAKFNIQFILASPYINYKQVREQVYKLRYIKNYYNRENERASAPNPYPGYLTDNSRGDDPLWKPIERIHRDGIFKYPQFTHPVPSVIDEQIVHKRLACKNTQSNRIRHRPGKKTICYFLDCQYLAGILVDENITMNEAIGHLRVD